MRRDPRPMGPRACGFIVVLLALTAVAGAAGCGARTAASPSPATPLSSPSASTADGSWTHVQSAHATAFTHSAERLTLPFRDFRRPGSWRVPDLTDHTAVLMKNAGEHQQLWLMDLSNGQTRQVFARATDARPGFWIGSVHISDGWLAWEEVGPGDDLAEPVDWKLYAAQLGRASLTAGKPMLIASASNAEATRPLFDISGSRLAWVSTAWASPGTAARSQLTVRDLASGRRLVSYRSQGVLDTVNLRGDQAIVGETPQSGARAARFKVLDLSGGDLLAGFEVRSEYSLSHWPAWRDGWLAWTPFPTRDATYPWLYVRDPSGHIYTEGGLAVDPVLRRTLPLLSNDAPWEAIRGRHGGGARAPAQRPDESGARIRQARRRRSVAWRRRRTRTGLHVRRLSGPCSLRGEGQREAHDRQGVSGRVTPRAGGPCPCPSALCVWLVAALSLPAPPCVGGGCRAS